MGWPFTSAVAPSFDSDVQAVPTTAALVTGCPAITTALWLMGAVFHNTTADLLTVTLQKGDGTVLMVIDVPASGVPVEREWAFLPLTGLKWVASGAGVTGKVWGYR